MITDYYGELKEVFEVVNRGDGSHKYYVLFKKLPAKVIDEKNEELKTITPMWEVFARRIRIDHKENETLIFDAKDFNKNDYIKKIYR